MSKIDWAVYALLIIGFMLFVFALTGNFLAMLVAGMGVSVGALHQAAICERRKK